MTGERIGEIIGLIKKEVKPALGCTEPIAVALAVARAVSELKHNSGTTYGHSDINELHIDIEVSANIMKNGMGVGIPGTGMVGLHIAAAMGAVCGDPDLGLEVLKELDDTALEIAKSMLKNNQIKISLSEQDSLLYISATATYGEDSATTIIEGDHDNIKEVIFNNKIAFQKETYSDKTDKVEENSLNKTIIDYNLTIKEILEFATNVDFSDIEFILESETLNMALAEEGLKNEYGLRVGQQLAHKANLDFFGDNIMTYAMSYTAAASDARMAGCKLPAMSNSGSGNQGITVTLPVIAVSRKLRSDRKSLARALALSHLVAIHIKGHLGKLSALCGCIVASAGSSCGIIYLYSENSEKKYEQMCAALKNMFGNITGMVCDGAKVGCALKVASGVSSAIQSAVLALNGISISENDGIIDKDIEQSIRNLALIGKKGMKVTDELILRIMSEKH